MSGHRRVIMTLREPAVLIDMGLDMSITFLLSGDTLVVSGGYGGVGTHTGVQGNYPYLYFGENKCYANGKVWDLTKPLPLGFTPSKVKEVQLLDCGRMGVNVGERKGSNYVIWTDTTVTANDGAGSSTRWYIKIIFER